MKLGRVVPARCLRKGPASLLSAGALGFSPPAKSFVWAGAVRLCHRGLPSSFPQPLPPPLTSFSLFSPPWMDSHRPQLQHNERLPLLLRLPASPQVAGTSLGDQDFAHLGFSSRSNLSPGLGELCFPLSETAVHRIKEARVPLYLGVKRQGTAICSCPPPRYYYGLPRFFCCSKMTTFTILTSFPCILLW